MSVCDEKHTALGSLAPPSHPSEYVMEASWDNDLEGFQYAPSHDGDCCIIRTSPTQFKVVTGKDIFYFSAGCISNIIGHPNDLYDTNKVSPHKVPGNFTFASVANKHWVNYLLPMYNPTHKLTADDPYPLTHTKKLIPPEELFGIDTHGVLEPGEEVILPGYVSVSASDHKMMKEIALRKALFQQRKSAEAAKARAAKRALKVGKGKQSRPSGTRMENCLADSLRSTDSTRSAPRSGLHS
ncbi:hypothetical protein AAF712_013893 [Marasmius tenuissimus]|uniref:Uncharacterized protein n=1 Tax=Marasmius tenuissimus TaxID=585030 RepID=A0ABR2ZDL0_9AGAR